MSDAETSPAPFTWRGQSSSFVKIQHFRTGSSTGVKKEKKLATHDWRCNGPQSIATPEKHKTKPGYGKNASV